MYSATLQYFCPNCGYKWEETFQFESVTSSGCNCPNCEEPVTATIKS